MFITLRTSYEKTYTSRAQCNQKVYSDQWVAQRFALIHIFSFFNQGNQRILCTETFSEATLNFWQYKRKDTLWNVSFRGFHEIQFHGHFMKHEILLWNTFTLVSNIHCVCFSSIKNCVCRERIKISRVKFNRKDIV